MHTRTEIAFHEHVTQQARELKQFYSNLAQDAKYFLEALGGAKRRASSERLPLTYALNLLISKIETASFQKILSGLVEHA